MLNFCTCFYKNWCKERYLDSGNDDNIMNYRNYENIADVYSVQIPEFTDKGNDNPAKRHKVSGKSLFKLKISELLSLEYNPVTGNFTFKNEDFSLVMCGGKIVDIFRDDFIFSFELNDSTGTIVCFHKFKYDRNATMKNLTELPTTAQFLQTTINGNENSTHPTDDESVFNWTSNDTVVRNFENDTNDAFRAVLSWFNDEVVEKQKTCEVGDIVHVVGHLMQNETDCRKINVVDFRIVANEDDLKDLMLEMDFLNRCIY